MILRTLLPAILAGAIAMSCASSSSDRFVLYPVDTDPTVSFRIWFNSGAQMDPPGKEGLACLTARMLTEAATSKNSYEDVLSKLYPMAASYESSVDKEMTVISGRVHRDNLEAYYTLFTDALLHPAFREDDFKRITSDMINSIEKTLRYSSDEELGKAALYDFVYAGTPYGHRDEGTVAGLKAITLDDVRSFYSAQYTRGNYVIGLGGGFDTALQQRLDTDLQTLPAVDVRPPAAPQPATIEGLNVLLVEKQCNATAISIGAPVDVLRGGEDFFALALFNSWFGEHRNSSSHLYQVIREERGMNYGDYSYIEIFPEGGMRQMPPSGTARRSQLFEIWLRPVQHAHRHFALRAALRELQHAVDHGLTEEQFALTQAFLDKYALHFATSTSGRLGYAVDSRFHGIDENYIALYRKHIAALTREQVNAAIKKHLQAKNLRIAIVTEGAEAFKQALVTDAPSPVTYDTPKPASVTAEDREIESWPLRIDVAKVRIVPVESMFER
jgi:zinc protease